MAIRNARGLARRTRYVRTGSVMPLISIGACALDLEHASHVPIGLVADAQRACGRRLLHAGGDVDADAADAALGVDAAAEQDRTGVDADPQVEAVEAEVALHVGGERRRLGEDREAGAHRALGVVLERLVGAEDGEQAVAGVLEDPPLVRAQRSPVSRSSALSMTAWTSSGSRRWLSCVEPTTSMNSTVAVFSCCAAPSRWRSAASFSWSGATAIATTASPSSARCASSAAMADSICSAVSSMAPADAFGPTAVAPVRQIGADPPRE